MKINPAHVIQFVAIIEEGSFARAAERLNLSQPALSRNIKILEDRIGATLMTRGRKGVSATDIGVMLCGYGQSMRDAYQLASEMAQSVSSGHLGNLRLGATPHMLDSLLAAPLASFMQMMPGVSYRLAPGTASELMERVKGGEVDLAICPVEIVESHELVTFRRLIEDRMEIFAGAQHPLAGSTRVGAADLAAARWIVHPEGSLLRQQMESGLLTLGVDAINAALQTGSRQMIVDVMSRVDVLSVLPSAYFRREFREGALVVLKPSRRLPNRPIGAAYHAKIPLSTVARRFLKHFVQWAGTAK